MSDEKRAELTRRRLLKGTAALAAVSLLPRSANAEQPLPSGKICPQIGVVNVSNLKTATIPAGYVGLSYEKYRVSNVVGQQIFQPTNTNLQALFKLLSGNVGGVLRLGGGSQDMQTYGTTGASGTTIAPVHIKNLAGFLSGITTPQKWECIYGINLRGDYLAAGVSDSFARGTNAQLAHDEVLEVQNAGINLIGVEMGNEPDTWGGTELMGTYPPNTNKTWSLTAYEALWQYYRNRQPSAPIAATAGGSDQQVPSNWSQPFAEWAKGEGIPVHLITQHFYILDGKTNPTVNDLRDWNISDNSAGHTRKNIADFISTMGQPMQQITQMYGTPCRLAETNSYWSGGTSGVSDAFVSALWVIDYLFTAALYGVTGTNFHGGLNAAYSPLFDDGFNVQVVNPIFYGLTFFNMALDATAGTGDLLTTTTDQFYGENVTAYCLSTSATTASVVIINKSAEYYFKPTINLPFPFTSANLIDLTTSSSAGLAARNWDGVSSPPVYSSVVSIRGATITLEGEFSPSIAPYALTTTPSQDGETSSVTCWLPTISAILITLAY